MSELRRNAILSGEGGFLGLVAIARAMGINSRRASYLIACGDIASEETRLGLFVSKAALDAWLATEGAMIERSIEAGASLL